MLLLSSQCYLFGFLFLSLHFYAHDVYNHNSFYLHLININCPSSHLNSPWIKSGPFAPTMNDILTAVGGSTRPAAVSAKLDLSPSYLAGDPCQESRTHSRDLNLLVSVFIFSATRGTAGVPLFPCSCNGRHIHHNPRQVVPVPCCCYCRCYSWL